ncbi:UNVERIFIED_CONTAM: hypothetical protein K2H54_047368 [Gekko kuhli]
MARLHPGDSRSSGPTPPRRARRNAALVTSRRRPAARVFYPPCSAQPAHKTGRGRSVPFSAAGCVSKLNTEDDELQLGRPGSQASRARPPGGSPSSEFGAGTQRNSQLGPLGADRTRRPSTAAEVTRQASYVISACRGSARSPL